MGRKIGVASSTKSKQLQVQVPTRTILSVLLLFLPMVSLAWVVPLRLARRRPLKLSALFQSTSTTTTAATTTIMDFNKNIQTTQIPCPPVDDTNDDDNYSLNHLQKRTEWLIANHTTIGKVCLAIAGGGGHALSTLAATSGASQLLLEGTVTYDRASFQDYVQRKLPNDKSFSYSSVDAAQMASERALLQAMQLRSKNNHNNDGLKVLKETAGLGSASTLKTTTKGGMSKSGRPSHGNIVATCSNGRQVGMQLTLNCPTQNRFQQDVFVSHMILQTLEEVSKVNKGIVENRGTKGKEEDVDPREFEGVTIQQWHAINATESQCPVQSAAERILSGDEEAVLLLPKDHVESSAEGCNFLEALKFPVLPDNCLIMPGSYNPPHKGHVSLAKAAISKSSPSDEELRPLVFEISITNADKPAMEPDEVARRVAQFNSILKNADGIPQWGILLTSAPLFSQKVKDLQRYAPASLETHPKFPVTEESNRWSFVIGSDTMVRVLNPKYYNDDYDQMLEAQRNMGADFVVGGRLEQKGEDSAKFVTGEEALEGLPQDVQDMFLILSESDFRVDISSTELREKQSGSS